MKMWVSGAASGFGAAISAKARSAGWTVVGVDVEPAAGVQFVDVRDASAVRASIEAADADVVFANAGFGAFGPIDAFDEELMDDLWRTNVLGVWNVARWSLAGLRAKRGVWAVSSSVAGRMVFPESGPYAATKHAVEALAEALYLENASFGVRVRVLEPGAHRTGFGPTATRRSPPRLPTDAVAPLRPVWDERKSEVLVADGAAEGVADALMRSLGDPVGFLRLPVGVDAENLIGARDALGPTLAVRAMADRLGVGTGALLTPDEVLRDGAERDARWAATASAASWGQLEHWARGPDGVAALARLRASPPTRC